MRLLEQILQYKKEQINHLTINKKRNRPIFRLKDFCKTGQVNIIAEIKQSSPSFGTFNIDPFSVAEIYKKYAKGISVLTDDMFFGGGFELLEKLCSVNMPILAKDFFIDKKQIDKAYSCGADIILLIVRILDDERLLELYDYAIQLGLDVLVEVHSLDELKRIKSLKPAVVGINSRDLDSLSISLKKAKTIIKNVDFECIKVAESGIKTKKDIEFFGTSADGFLIGEALLEGDVEEKFREFLG